jgi:lipoprotein-anchoring transpeptidase ErfK/SrfK
MAMRALAFVMLAAVALGGCMQDVATGTLDPSTDANWKQRDKDLMSNLPYNQSAVSEAFRRHIVDYHRKEAPGTIVVDSDNRYLYYVLAKGKAIRYGIAVGEEAQAWSGVAKVGRMEEWPAWHPTPGEQARLGPLPEYVTGGPHNPMGSRGMYLFSNNRDTLYRIHGTNQPEYIGTAVSSGCIRMTNEDAIDLYNRVKVGTLVIVLAPHQNDNIFGAHMASTWGSSPN